jgi:predicted ATPase
VSARDSPATDDALYLRDLIEAPQPDEARRLYEAMDTAARARGKELALARLVEEASHRQPLLMIVEDVHWADAETLGQLAALARAAAQCRAALALTTRIGGDPLDAGWRAAAAGGFQLTIDLAPLTSTEAETIASSFGTGEEFATKCVERAGGNPLFLEQLLRAARDLVDGKLPSTVQSVVLARADLLAPNDRRAIEAASVLGQRFALATLSEPWSMTGATTPKFSCATRCSGGRPTDCSLCMLWCATASTRRSPMHGGGSFMAPPPARWPTSQR